MHFSLKSLAPFLVLTQSGFALAGLCRPTAATSSVATTTATVDQSTSTSAILTTTSLAESTTTTAAATTTTSTEPLGTPLVAVLSDGTEAETYLSSELTLGSQGTTPALFILEPETGRLTTTGPDGTKLYLETVIPLGPQLAFMFDTYQDISTNEYRFFVTCQVVSGYLSCESENGNTPINWYIESNRFWGNKYQVDGVTTAQFKFQ